MRGENKTNQELLTELNELKAKISKFEDIESKNKKLEQELKENKLQLSAFFSNSPVGLGIWNSEFQYVYLNELLQKMNGPSIEDHIGKSVTEILPEADKIIVPLFKEILQSGKSFLNIELKGEVPSAPGEVRHFLSSYFPISGLSQKPELIGAIIVDITDKKRAESFNSKLIDAMQDGFSILDPSGKHIEVNNSLVKMTGFSKEELIGTKAPHPYWPPEELENIEKALNETFKGNFRELDLVFMRKNGERFPVKVNPSQILDEMGNIISFFATVKDVSEQKKAYEKLKESEEKFKTLVTNNEEIIYIIGKDGKFILSEGKGLSKLGIVPGQVVGQSVFELFKDYPEMLTDMKKALEGKTLTKEHKVNGQYFRNWYSPYRNINGEIIGLLGLSVNITEKKVVEESLIESEKKLRDAQKMAGLGFWIWNVKTGEVEWSEEVYKIFNLGPETFTPQIDSIQALSPWPVEHDRDKELIEKLSKSKEPGEYEQRFLFPDGSIGYYYSTYHGIYNEQDELKYIQGTVQDITKRKLAEIELQNRNTYIESILNNLPIGIGVNSIDNGDVKYLNSKFEEIYGWTKDTLTNVSIFFEKVFPDAEYREKMKSQIMEDMESGDPERMVWDNLKIATSRGEERRVKAYNIPLLDQNLMISTAQDVTAQKLAEEELMLYKENLEKLVAERTLELEHKNKELDDAMKVFVGREMLIKKLEDKIRTLQGT